MVKLYVVINIYEDVSWDIELITANLAEAHLRMDAMRLDVLKCEKSIGPGEDLDTAWDNYINEALQATNITLSTWEYEPGLEPEDDPLTPWLS